VSEIRISAPLSDETISSLRSGQAVLISGVIFAARDTAHRRIVESIKEDREVPFNLAGALVYYVGPTPPPPGRPIGSAGPTTAGRMDAYAPLLIENGLKGMLGKGERNDAVKEACIRHKAVYMATLGGCGALLGLCIKKAELIAWPELGPEGVWRFEVEDFPAVVVNDIYGGDAYAEGRKQYEQSDN